MGVIKDGQFLSAYYGDQIDALLAAMAQANPLPSGTDWIAFIDDCRAAQSAAEAAQTAAETAEGNAASSASTASQKATQAATSATTAYTASENAAASAQAASGYASTATAKASEAAASATTAANASADALTYRDQCDSYRDQCASYEDDAHIAAISAASSEDYAADSATSAAASASTATDKASEAAASAASVASMAKTSESWAIGGTDTREGEDTNNAKYWAEQASHAAGGGVYSFNNRAGYVLPQSGDYTVDMVKGALPIYGKGHNLLDNAYFGDAAAIIDQRGGYVLTDTATYYTDTALTQNPVTVSAYTTVYYPDAQSGYVGFYLTDDPTGTKYYASRSDCVRGYVGAGYGIDRWKMQNNTQLIVGPNAVSLTEKSNYANIYQEIDTNLNGKTLTLSVLLDTGLKTKTFVASTTAQTLALNSEGTIMYLRCLITENNRTRVTFFAGSGATSSPCSANVIGVALELGDIQTCWANIGTDANPVWVPSSIPDPTLELLKCQRYYHTYETEALRPSKALDCVPVMRINPTQTTIGAWGKTLYANDANL